MLKKKLNKIMLTIQKKSKMNRLKIRQKMREKMKIRNK